MSCKMLFFDYRESEKNFFKEHHFENFDIKFFEESLNEVTLESLDKEDLENAMIISVFITSNVDEKIISKFKNLRIISTRSTGYDHICLNSCAMKNIALVNVEAYGNTTVAQYTMALILMLVRKLYQAISSQKDIKPKYGDYCGRNLNNLTIGVIGTGSIGCAVCNYSKAFGMKILAYDVRQRNDLINETNVEYTDLDYLLKNSDIITLHLPNNNETYHMIGREQFEMMKDGAYFVNVSRGELVDTEALLEFAKNGKFEGIALDVVACPVSDSDNKGENRSAVTCVETSETVRELSKMQNVILTPHMAYDTQEAIDYILNLTFKSLSDYVQGGRANRVI